jgi:hypothetical protein
MMKQLKRIALGVSLAFAAVGSANAALVNGAATTTGSSLMLAAYGNVGGTILSYTRDLGAFLSSTLNLSGSTVDSSTGTNSAWNTGGFSFSSAGDSLFTSLFGTGGSAITSGTIKWAVVAVDSNSSPVPAQAVYTAASVGGIANNGSVVTAAGNISNQFIAGSNAAGCTSATSCSTVGTGSDSAAGAAFTSGLFSPAISNVFGSAFNSALSFYYSRTTSTSGLAGSSRSAFAGSWQLGNDGTVTYSVAGGSPVPLPAAAWLLASGLLGLAAVGRRRKNGSIA